MDSPRTFTGLTAFALLAALITTGCVATPSPDRYERHEVMQRYTEEAGTVLAARTVRIQGTGSGVGTVVGASVGGGVGSRLGQGEGARINAALGAVAGAIVGRLAENAHADHDGTEVSVRLESGAVISVVVPGVLALQPGMPVRVLSRGHITRVVPVLAAGVPEGDTRQPSIPQPPRPVADG
jgi:outer membrane lipoprotein SlyB